MADIQPPDLETKMAILDKKAEAEGVKLPDDVRSFMASKTKSNVRELEGALVKLIAYSSLTGTPINLQMAQQVLKHLVHVQDRRVTIDSIQKAVAERFQIKQSQLKEKSNTKKVVYPRQVAMYLVKELTDASLPEIGRAFGGKHHTTVIHSINKIEQDTSYRSGIEQATPQSNGLITMNLVCVFHNRSFETGLRKTVQNRLTGPVLRIFPRLYSTSFEWRKVAEFSII